MGVLCLPVALSVYCVPTKMGIELSLSPIYFLPTELYLDGREHSVNLQGQPVL